MANDSIENVIDKIKRTKNPIDRMRLGLKFFTKSSNYSREPIGWGEDYAYIDDGPKVAQAALRKSSKVKRSK